MADIAKLTHLVNVHNANRAYLDVEESFEQMTLVAAEAIEAGNAVYINSAGKFANADASAAGTADPYGIATRKVAAGEPVTAIARGVVYGYDFSQGYGSTIYLSDTGSGATAGQLADAAGTVNKPIGRILPAGDNVARGVSMKKMLQVRL